MTLGLPVSTMIAFMLVLSRVGGLIAFLPIPGFRNAPDMMRIGLALTLTFALFPAWPSLPNVLPSLGQLGSWALGEAGFGLFAGLCIALLTEGFQIAAQVIGMQAGYGFASTVDPTNQADAGLIQVLMNLFTGLLFFTLGIDHALIRVLAASFQKFPAGSWTITAVSLDGVLKLASGMFAIGLRLAMPVIALLMLIDLALALLGRMQQQLQLLSLAFPVKMLAALGLLAALTPVIERMFDGAATRAIGIISNVVAAGPR
jgi:flagellar biosynthetic protein FliR